MQFSNAKIQPPNAGLVSAAPNIGYFVASFCFAAASLTGVAVVSCASTSKRSDVVARLSTGDCRIGAVCAIDFGSVAIGTSEVRAFSVMNIGSADDEITRAETTGDAVFNASEGLAGPLAAGGDAVPVAVAATPRNRGQASGQLMIHTASGVIALQLTATGTSGSLDITPLCDFGDVPVGSPSAPCGVVILNAGAGPIVVDSLELVGAPFAIEGVFVAPLAIPAGQSVSLNIIATPANTGLSTGSLTLMEGGVVRESATVLRVNGVAN